MCEFSSGLPCHRLYPCPFASALLATILPPTPPRGKLGFLLGRGPFWFPSQPGDPTYQKNGHPTFRNLKPETSGESYPELSGYQAGILAPNTKITGPLPEITTECTRKLPATLPIPTNGAMRAPQVHSKNRKAFGHPLAVSLPGFSYPSIRLGIQIASVQDPKYLQLVYSLSKAPSL